MAHRRLLIAAPDPAGRVLLEVARAAGFAAEWFHHPSSRDPTFELPVLGARFLPDIVLVVAPSREEPATLELLRERGAFVVVVVLPLEPAAPRHMLSRQRWVCRAADAVVVAQDRSVSVFHDRRGRQAVALPLLADSLRDAADAQRVRSAFQALAETWQELDGLRAER